MLYVCGYLPNLLRKKVVLDERLAFLTALSKKPTMRERSLLVAGTLLGPIK